MKNEKKLYADNLLNNLQMFSGKRICAMVKSNAYGHGLKEIVKLIEDKVEMFGVVNIDEGKSVKLYTDKPVLVCSRVDDFRACKKSGLDIMIEDELDLTKAIKFDLQENLHLKINCGMNRFGVKSALALKQIDNLLCEKDIKLRSIYTHFPCTENVRNTQKNYAKFCELRKEIPQKPAVCFGGSGIYAYNFDFDILRLGIGLYGYGRKDLRPVMKICSFVSKVFFAKRGEFIGYGHKYHVKNDGYFAIVPVGYGDGLRRNLSGNFHVQCNGKKYSAIGNICMDAFFMKIDCDVKVGDEVVVMDNADYLAKKCGTISYEILTGFSNLRGKTIVEL